jgi:hypothetical protein
VRHPRKQEDRNRQKAVFSACRWDKSTASPVLLRATITGLWEPTQAPAANRIALGEAKNGACVFMSLRVYTVLCACMHYIRARVHCTGAPIYARMHAVPILHAARRHVTLGIEEQAEKAEHRPKKQRIAH